MPLPYTYTTKAELESLFGTEDISPVEIRMDDAGAYAGSLTPTESDALTDVINEASHEINFYLVGRYTPETLNANSWVRRAASIIGCYLLSQRRGDPAQFADAYKRIIARLDEIYRGHRFLPLEPTRHADEVPAMSNIIVSDRYGQKKLRVEDQVSEGGQNGSQHLDRYFYFDP